MRVAEPQNDNQRADLPVWFPGLVETGVKEISTRDVARADCECFLNAVQSVLCDRRVRSIGVNLIEPQDVIERTYGERDHEFSDVLAWVANQVGVDLTTVVDRFKTAA